MPVRGYSFEVLPTDWVPGKGSYDFEPFILDVPSTIGDGAAARRAWWSAFTILGSRGFEPEDFIVREYSDEFTVPGRVVDSAGFIESKLRMTQTRPIHSADRDGLDVKAAQASAAEFTR